AAENGHQPHEITHAAFPFSDRPGQQSPSETAWTLRAPALTPREDPTARPGPAEPTYHAPGPREPLEGSSARPPSSEHGVAVARRRGPLLDHVSMPPILPSSWGVKDVEAGAVRLSWGQRRTIRQPRPVFGPRGGRRCARIAVKCTPPRRCRPTA